MELLLGLLAIPMMLFFLIAPLAIVSGIYAFCEKLFGEMNILVSIAFVLVVPTLILVFIDALLLGA